MLGTVGLLTVAAFVFSRDLMALVLTVSPMTLRTLSPHEALTANLRLSLTAGVIASSPVVAWQLWRFVSPGLYPRERRIALAGAAMSVLLFCGGAAFGLFVLLRPTLLLFRSFEGGLIEGAWTLSNFTAFLGQFVLVFGVCFELPLVVLLLAALGIVEPRTLGRYRRHVFIGLLILGAILPPNDPLTQILLALPLYILFELSILAARLMVRRGAERS